MVALFTDCGIILLIVAQSDEITSYWNNEISTYMGNVSLPTHAVTWSALLVTKLCSTKKTRLSITRY